jgi:hypothetical protein
MTGGKLNRLLPIGLLFLAAGFMLHLWTKGDYFESAAGFLIGISIVFILLGLAQRGRGIAR